MNTHNWQNVFIFILFGFFLKKEMFIMHSDLVSRVNNLVGYNLPDSYLGTPLSIFTINISLGNKNIKNVVNIISNKFLVSVLCYIVHLIFFWYWRPQTKQLMSSVILY